MTHSITFYKMHACGNDFVMVYNHNRTSLNINKKYLRSLANRRTGIGFDQFIIINYSTDANINMYIYNADGSEAEACGNATRCVAKWLFNKFTDRSQFTIKTAAGILVAKKVEQNIFEINMGCPGMHWQQIPLKGAMNTNYLPIANCQPLPINVSGLGQPAAVSIGNPHFIFFVKSLDSLPIRQLGPHLEHHEFFPNRTNVDFAHIISSKRVRLMVWERGTGITLGCGSGACATVVAAFRRGLVDNRVIVEQEGGEIAITYDHKCNNVFMTGDAHLAFEGILPQEAFLEAV
ncbi:MAG: diaminopimelate epimerase [Pseudomonadota bacterium]